jgi:hypothetical protein
VVVPAENVNHLLVCGLAEILVVRPNGPEVFGRAQADHKIGHALLLKLSHCVCRAHRDCQHHHCCALHPHGLCCSTGCHSCRKSIVHKHHNLACHRQVRPTLAVRLHTPLQLLPLAVNGVLQLLLSGSNSLHSRLVYDCGSGVPALCNGANSKLRLKGCAHFADNEGIQLC